jgi:hypothetical protein
MARRLKLLIAGLAAPLAWMLLWGRVHAVAQVACPLPETEPMNGVPSLSTWMAIAFGAALAVVGTLHLRRREGASSTGTKAAAIFVALVATGALLVSTSDRPASAAVRQDSCDIPATSEGTAPAPTCAVDCWDGGTNVSINVVPAPTTPAFPLTPTNGLFSGSFTCGTVTFSCPAAGGTRLGGCGRVGRAATVVAGGGAAAGTATASAVETAPGAGGWRYMASFVTTHCD